MYTARAQIDFYGEAEFSVAVETSAAEDGIPQEIETALFCLYAARQVANLRALPGVGASVGHTLLAIDVNDPRKSLREALGETEIVPARPGRETRSFTAELRFRSLARGVRFKLKARGFGIRAVGTGYYVPTAVMGLLYYLLDQRRGDVAYQAMLVAAARNLGAMAARGNIGIRNQVSAALAATAEGWRNPEPPEGVVLESL